VMARRNVTDRAHRYRANALAPAGARVCALCGSRSNLMVDHKDGHPDHTTRGNLQWLCRGCNTAKGLWYKQIGKGRLTHQYNPAEGVPSYQQYAWAVAQHSRGEHDEGGAIIHATPVEVRREYASRIASVKRSRGRMADDERWNPIFGRTSTHYTRASGGKFQKVEGGDVKAARRASLVAARREKAELAKQKREGSAAERKREGARLRESKLPEWQQRMHLREGNPGVVIRKVGKLWRAYLSKQDANLRRNEIAAAVSREKLMASLKRNPASAAAGARNPSSRVAGIKAGGKLHGASDERLDRLADEWIKTQGYLGLSIPHERDQYRAGLQDAVDDYRRARKRNPSDGAAEAFKEFHGHESEELVSVKQKVHFHTHLAGAGELRGMSVKPIGHGLEERHIGGLKGALLAFNEAKNQLFVRGGDQFMSESELGKFGIRKPHHELETLGKLTALDYFTNKTHLGSEGGRAVYNHKLRTTNQDGKHVVVTIARYPDLIYRVLDQQFEFSGGSYIIRAEGIDK
jgi:hypothetical protein